MIAFGRCLISCAASGAMLVHSALASEPRSTELTPPRWALWTAGELHWSGPVGAFQPSTSPNPPGLGLTALLRPPSGSWGLRGHLAVSRYRTSHDGIYAAASFMDSLYTFYFTVRDASDLVWALAGPQWGSTAWPGSPSVYAMAGVASLRTRIAPVRTAVVVSNGPWLRSDATAFATAIGACVRWPLDSGHRFEVTTGADYRWTAPINYSTAPTADSIGNHLQSRRSSLEMITIRLGPAARWGGD